MPNAVYTKSLEVLSRSISELAADTLLKSALRERQLSPDEVSAEQMQRVLTGPLLHQLGLAITPERAQRDLQQLSLELARDHPRAPTLFTDLGAFANWDEHHPAVTEWTGEGDLSTPQQAAPAPAGADLGDDWADDFEFDDPEYTVTHSRRHYQLADAADQEALIQDLGRMQGVQGVLVTRQNGEILRVKALRDATHLGSVAAATAMLFRQRGLKLMSADLGGQTICMRPLGEYSVTVMAGPQINIGRLLAELQQIGVKE